MLWALRAPEAKLLEDSKLVWKLVRAARALTVARPKTLRARPREVLALRDFYWVIAWVVGKVEPLRDLFEF